MTGAQTAALLVALVAPVVALLGPDDRRAATPPSARSRSRSLRSRSRSSRSPSRRRLAPKRLAPFRWPQAGAVVAAGAWLALVVSGARGHAMGLHLTPLVAAAGCGAALLAAASLEGMTRRRSQVATCVALTAVGAGLTAGADGAQPAAVVGGLALAVVLTIDPTTSRRGPEGLARAFLGAGGVAACAAGFVVLHDRSGQWTLPATPTLSAPTIVAFIAAAAFLSLYATLGTRLPAPAATIRSGSLLLAGGLVVGLSTAPLRAPTTDLGVATVVLAGAAVAAAGLRRGASSLALFALAAAAGPPALSPAARLLAAAAVITVAVGGPWVWLVALPGAVSLAMGVVDDGGRLALATAVAATAVALVLAELAVAALPGADEAGSSSGLAAAKFRPTPGALPAVMIGAWLFVAAGTWTWTGASLGVYDQGMGRAVAAGLLAVVGCVLAGELGIRGVPGRASASGAPPPPPARPRRRLTQLVRLRRSASPPRPRRPAHSQRARPRARSSARPPKGTRRPRPRRSRPPRARPGPERPSERGPGPERPPERGTGPAGEP